MNNPNIGSYGSAHVTHIINQLETAKEIITYGGQLANTFQAKALKACQNILNIQETFKNLNSSISNEDKIKLASDLRNRINEFDLSSVYIQGCKNAQSIKDIMHDSLVVLTEVCPLNTEDPITQELIPTENCVSVSTGQQFDLLALFEFHRKRDCRGEQLGEGWLDSQKYLINPITNIPFSYLDFRHIVKAASEKNIHMPDTKKLVMFDSSTTEPEIKLSLYNPLHFKRIVKSLNIAVSIAKKFPYMSNQIYSCIMDSDYFAYIGQNIKPTELKNLVEQYPSHIKDIYQRFLQDSFFERLPTLDFRQTLELFSVFPQHKNHIFDKIMTINFSPEEMTSLLVGLISEMPERRDDIYQRLLYVKKKLNEMDILNIVNAYPERSENIYNECMPRFNYIRNKNITHFRDELCSIFPSHVEEINERWRSLS